MLELKIIGKSYRIWKEREKIYWKNLRIIKNYRGIQG